MTKLDAFMYALEGAITVVPLGLRFAQFFAADISAPEKFRGCSFDTNF